jgi:ATP/maltotriose-dependent transcriptional regulator MalT
MKRRMARSGHDWRPIEGGMANPDEASAALASGHAWLAQGDWVNARAAFETVLRLGEIPEALEGLGMAAWWLDDAAAVFEARERAYQLYRRRGDRRAAGRLAMLIGVDAFHFRGQAAVANGWHRRAHSLLDGLPTTPEHGWLSLWRSEIALSTGQDVVRVREAAAATVALARALEDADLEMLAVAQEGLALVMHGAVDVGMARLDEATTAALSGEMANPVAIGIACCHLVTACELVRDLARAAEWCERVREYSARIKFNVLVSVCRIQHATVLMWGGAWSEAETELERALEHVAVARVREPALVCLAELRRRQGRLADAEAVLARIAWHPHARLLRAALALEQGDADSAADQARRFLQHAPASNRSDRAVACDLRLRAELALGRAPGPRMLDEIRELAAGVGTDVIRAAARAAEGLVAAACGEQERARGALEDAVDLYGRAGASHEAARARLDLARTLLALGRQDAARAELERARTVFEELGAARDALAVRALLPAASGPDRTASARGRRPGGLSAREVEVLGLLAQGLNNPAIAGRLGVSAFTVKRHVANILTKLDLPTRAAAAAHAAREGWV